ncbi:MAG: GPR endopeptidase [Oscillospiraceae bacterium]|nr:GPR endopeptidase [Oscillospiraceae bacterium]
MSTKTDLAKEIIVKKSPVYSKMRKYFRGKTEITEIRIETDEESALIEKPKGTYITVEADYARLPFGDFDEELSALAAETEKLLSDKSKILVIGIGNPLLTADSLGPVAAEMIPCGKLFGKELCAFSPGTEGKTGIEPDVLISAAVEKLKPTAVILIDALAAEDISHICKTIQLTDSGLAPGSGAGKRKTALCKETLGTPTAAMGTPTVIRYPDSDSVFVSPNDIALMVKKAARLMACAITLAVFPELGAETVKEMVI